MPEVNFNLLAPTADLYSAPEVKMDPVAAYEKAKATRQSNMLAQLYAKHYDPQTGGVNYNALIPEAAQSGLDVSKLMPGVREQQESMASIAQKRALQQQEEATAAAKQQEMFKSNVDTAMKWSRSQLDNIKTPDEYLKWHEANHTNPYLAEFFKQNNISKEDRRSEINSLLSQEGGLQKLIDMSKQGLDNYLGVKPAETKQFQPTATEAEYALWQKDPAAYRKFKEAQKVETGSGATAGTTQIPKLKQGERWNPVEERVEQVPGSAEYNKQSKLHAADSSSLDTVKSTTKANVENVDAILKAANAWAAETNNGAKPLGNNASEDAKAFANLFPGSYTGYVTQYKSGATATLKAKYQKLQANAKNLGLQGVRVGGSIGTITEREWPMLQQQVLSLSPTMETAAAAAEIANIKNRFIDTQSLAADKYDTQWGGTQYYKGGSTVSTEDTQTPATVKNTPKIGDIVKGYKFKGGNPSDANSWEKVK